MKLKDKICYTGIWAQPVCVIVLCVLMKLILPDVMLSLKLLGALALFALLPVIWIWQKNLRAYNNGKRTFTVYDPFTANWNTEYMPSQKQKAMYPPVAEQMLFDQPEGVVFGKYKNKYVCKPLDEDGHVFVIGGSGSSKSSAIIIPTLISNSDVRRFVVDIKGELSYNSIQYDDEYVIVCNPSDRRQYGYDPFYALTPDSSKQDILMVMKEIAFSLISLPADIKEPFWKQSARNLLIGLLLYYYKQGNWNFIAIMDEIMTRPMRGCVNEIVANAAQTSDEYKYIVTFADMAEETFGGIETEVRNHLNLFATDEDIRYFLKENALKCNPHMLDQGYSIYLYLDENKLMEYNDLLQVMINQTFVELAKRPESAPPLIVCIDELPRIVSGGKLNQLMDGMRTLRSRNVTLCLVTQSQEALEGAYTPAEIADMMSNCSYRVILSSNTDATQKTICSSCGKYQEIKESISGEGGKRKKSVSYEDKNIVQPVDLVRLPKTGELILLSVHGYNRIQKTPYYEDKIMAPIVAANKEHNKKLGIVYEQRW